MECQSGKIPDDHEVTMHMNMTLPVGVYTQLGQLIRHYGTIFAAKGVVVFFLTFLGPTSLMRTREEALKERNICKAFKFMKEGKLPAAGCKIGAAFNSSGVSAFLR